MRNFRAHVAFRVLLLAAAIFLLIHAWDQPDWFMTTIFAGLAVVMITLELIRYVEKTNRDLQTFLLSIKHKDFTQSFSSLRRGKSFTGLRTAFNSIIGEFQNLRAEKESHYLYLKTIIEHVKVALICFAPDGEVQLMNRAAKSLLSKPYLNNIKAIARIDPKLLKVVESLQPGQRELVKTVIGHEMLQLAVQTTEFKLQDKSYRLVSLQNIQSELEEQEIDTWQRLIRVLTHEIMNSVTPIISLTVSINDMIEDKTGNLRNLSEIPLDDADDMHQGIKTIQSRSRGMLHFVNAYRNLTRIPTPKFEWVKVNSITQNIQTLLLPELDKRGIAFESITTDKDLTIQADSELIEQVLINLIKNAMEALEGRQDPRIAVIATQTNENRILIQVKDNGAGIDDEFINQIFIPFFTTKKKGSGIGLSLSRQIMQLHKGSISVQTSPEGGTAFTLAF